MVSEHLKTKERTARNSTNSEKQGEWWEAKSDYGLGKTRANAQGTILGFEANEQVPLGKESLTSDNYSTPCLGRKDHMEAKDQSSN